MNNIELYLEASDMVLEVIFQVLSKNGWEELQVFCFSILRH